MDMADLNGATPETAGGRIVRDAAGKPTGVLLDRAQELVEKKIPEPTQEEVERYISIGLEGMRACWESRPFTMRA